MRAVIALAPRGWQAGAWKPPLLGQRQCSRGRGGGAKTRFCAPRPYRFALAL